MSLQIPFDLDGFLEELHAELLTEGVSDRVIKRSIAAALRKTLEEGEE